ncbi:MAG TPA: amino acid adenylation domain-containing protein, partial [Herpetosiphonaceae bacterium]
HALFEAQAARTPGAVALRYDADTLTYGALNARANQLAHYLRTLGVGPEVGVGLCVTRSFDLVVGVLAILKAGGYYLPLDPAYPSDMLRFIATDANIAMILTQQALLATLPVTDRQIVCLDADWPTISEHSSENLGHRMHSANLAYVIYTSGSTGRPKGVQIPHAGMHTLMVAQREILVTNETSRVIQAGSLNFDSGIFEITLALLHGAMLCLVAPETVLVGSTLHDVLRRYKITHATLTPSVLATLPTSDLPDLQEIIAVGEALPQELVDRWATKVSFFNSYGPSETTIWATTAQCFPEMGPPAIGVPIPNAQVYVLDQYMQPVPIGVTGELHVSGPGLSRGYVGRPDLTAERFVPHPFSSQPGARLYKTGDVVRYRADGQIDFLGRIDHQVKVRGIRIEPGQIEARLRQHPGVQDCLVMIREDRPGDRQLVAYVVKERQATEDGHSQDIQPRSSFQLSTHDLYAFLEITLPRYMLPQAFVILDAWPLNPSRKVDRQALPAPELGRSILAQPYSAPRTPLEQTLVEVWEQSLGRSPIGIHDPFFALGGDSIHSGTLVALAQARGVPLTLPLLFQHQTIAALAAVLPSSADAVVPVAVPPFSLLPEAARAALPPALEDAYPLTRLQAGMFFHTAFSPDTPVYHNLTSFQLTAAWDEAQLRAALRLLLERHPVLRTAFVLDSVPALQLVQHTVALPLTVADLRGQTADAQQEWIAAALETELRQPFDERQAPLLRILVHRRTDSVFRCTFVMHHAILDGWSEALLFTELFTVYDRLLRALPPALPPIAAHFRDFVALEQASERDPQAQAFWQHALADALPTRLPRWPIPPSASPLPPTDQRADWTLPPAVTARLHQVAAALAVPLKSVVLAAHLRVLSLLSGQRQVLTGLVVNGRLETSDGARVLGLFLNTVPWSQRLPSGAWRTLIQATFAHEQTLLAVRRYPLAAIQAAFGAQPLFETAFNFIHFHVLRQLHALPQVRIHEETSFARTNFTLGTNFSLDPFTDSLKLFLEYDPKVLAPEHVQRIGDYYQQALSAIAADPDQPFQHQCLLGPAEQERLLRTWNTPPRAPRVAQSLHALFEAQAARTPGAVALRYDADTLTYGALNARANQLAHYLRTLGVG